MKSLTYEAQDKASPETGSSALIDHSEHELVKLALDALDYPPIVSSTLNWVLHARQLSSLVHMHYSIANDTLAAFKLLSESDKYIGVSAFAVQVDHRSTRAHIVLKPSQLRDCQDCDAIGDSAEAESLGFALKLPREILLSDSCNLDGSAPTVLLFVNLLSTQLGPWLDAAERLIQQCYGRVVLRFWHPPHLTGTTSNAQPGLQGFTVQATLKSTEYKVVDDRVFSTALFGDCAYGEEKCPAPEATTADELAWPKDAAVEANASSFTGLKVLKYLQDYGEGNFEKTAELLQSFSEDIPAVTRSEHFQDYPELDKEEAKPVLDSVRKLRGSIGDGDYLFINRMLFDPQSVSQSTEKLFQCLSAISVSAMALNTSKKEAGLSPAGTSEPKRPTAPGNGLRVDLHLSTSLQSSLVWFNDLFKDSRYKRWKALDVTNQTHIARYVTMIGKEETAPEPYLQLVKVKSHHLSLVLLVDPGDMQQFMYTAIPETIVRSDIPIRVGIVMVPNGRVSSLIAASFHYFLRAKGRRTCAKFLQMIRQVLEYIGGGYQQIGLSEEIVELAFKQIAADVVADYASASEVLQNDEEVKIVLDEAREFAEQKQLFKEASQEDVPVDADATPKFSMLGVLNGVVLRDISADIWPVSLAEQTRIAKLLQSDAKIADEDSASEFQRWVVSDPGLIVVEGLSQEMRSGDQSLTRFKSEGDLRRLSPRTVFALREELKAVAYLEAYERSARDVSFGITIWLAALDMTGESFRNAESWLKEIASSEFASRTKSRYAVLVPGTELHVKVLDSATRDGRHEGVFVINGRILDFSSVKSMEELKVEIASEYEGELHSESIADVKLLESLFEKEVSSACSIIGEGISRTTEHVPYEEVREALETAKVPMISTQTVPTHGKAQTTLQVLAVINPMGSSSFVLSALCNALLKTYTPGVAEITLVLATTVAELKKQVGPPMTFSKFVLGTGTRVDLTSGQSMAPRAQFSRLPLNKVVTFAVEPPRAWFVSSYSTNYDMDNVVLDSLPNEAGILNAEYELSHLIVEGSCVDEEDAPPQGLKLILENDAGLLVDTLVMANLGYFQLKVPLPGRWSLRLATGPSSTIFSLKAMEMYSGNVRTVYKSDGRGRLPILVESLSGAGGILLRVERNPGMDGLSVLNLNKTEALNRRKGMGEKLKETISRLYKAPDTVHSRNAEHGGKGSEVINVFSVASGHLYERFLKIMMTSATRHASRPIKFWLLDNYLSPSFKKMLPHFAEKLGCEVGMVTYKWPGWLRAQTEKQRIIWAYKILFLDVLFPLDVDRIVFVDSDQVLRGDLAELMDIDLNGAPYGYVPFCDSRKEVEGYRFWKQGFWKETLQGQRYRISALYVVDLIRFRETAAGDTLRFVYQSLSADPNSLSNLDQDLPNYASASSLGRGKNVPIFDLPSDWLWCESWCDDESKKTAKAIDLCNNPMTKEPKLQSAKRIIAEWVDYDEAASDLTERIYKEIVGKDESLAGDTEENLQCRTGSEERCRKGGADVHAFKAEL